MKKIDPSILIPAKRGPKSFDARLDAITQAEQRLSEAKRAVMAEQRAAARARKESLERMIGAACMADRANSQTFAVVRTALDKHFTDDKNRAFLGAEGWLANSPAGNIKETEK